MHLPGRCDGSITTGSEADPEARLDFLQVIFLVFHLEIESIDFHLTFRNQVGEIINDQPGRL